MIFKTLFTPAYKSSDTEKRISSIANLDPSNEKQKSILHELAFNDDSDKVAIAALEKLNSFILWVKTAETGSSAWLKKQAQKMVYTQLENPQIADDNWFQLHLSESKNKVMLDHMLFNSARLKTLPELSMKVLQTLDNEATLKRFYAEAASAQQQAQIIANTQDVKLLQRFKKTAKNDEIAASINAKLAHFEWISEQPAKVKQQVTLINARLLALKDAQDYTYIQREFEELSGQFEEAKALFQYIDELSAATFTEKYLSLKVSIQSKLKGLEEAHNKQLALQATTNELSEIDERVQQVQQQLALLLTSTDSSADAQIKILSSAIESANEELDHVSALAQTAAHRSLIKRLQQDIANIGASLANVPMVLALTEKARQVVQDFENVLQRFEGPQQNEVLDNKELDNKEPDSKEKSPRTKTDINAESISELEQQTKDVKLTFKTLQTQSDVTLPKSVLSAFNAVLSKSNKLVKSFKEEKQKQQGRIQSKIKVVNRLIQEGKFKAAISTFHHVSLAMQSLPQGASMRVTTAYESCKLEIEKLQDWQAYIAQPRKPALVEEAQALMNSKIDDYFERAEKVKQLRQQWSSLGVLHTEEDEALNKAFDEALEQAFAPCRVFFAELEKNREANYQKALEVIQAVKTVDLETVSSELIAIVDRFRKQFNAIGDMEKAKARSIKRKFNQALKPLQTRVHDWHAQNAILKEKLVAKAAKLSVSETPKDAAQEAKVLQKQWKEIGFAGKTQENQLWQAFREHNDALFAKYHEALTVQQTEQTEAINAIDQQVQDLANKIQSVSKKSDLTFYSQSHSELEQNLAQLDPKTAKRILPKLNAVENQYAEMVKRLNDQKQRDDLNALFDFLANYNNHDQLAKIEELPSRYRAWLKSELRVHDFLQGLNRYEIAQVAAILHDVDRDVDHDANRSAMNDTQGRSKRELQLALMAHKLEGNDVLLPEAVLAAFVALGPFTDADAESLNFMQNIYIGQAND